MMNPKPPAFSARRLARALAVAGSMVAGLALASPAEDAAQGEASLRNGDLITAMQLFRKAADAGHGPAQARMGDMMEASELNAEAVQWYQKAADQGEPAGDHGLGRMHVEGKGVPKDPAKALEHFQRAAQKNFPPALEALAAAYRTGSLGLAKNPQEAARLQALAKSLRDPARKVVP
ncbi:Sel1 repeat protein [Burkholderiales bacterium JOSHI_001]|nr:Sel1 repeat protein [Burkholderiales bacterium JOSHI_001]